MYDAECHKLIRTTSTVITRYNICEIVCKVYSRTLRSENLQSGFSKTGIYPYNCDCIPRESMAPATLYLSDSDSQKTVEGGIEVDRGDDVIFEKRVVELKRVKHSVEKKQRNTASKIVIGKEGTDREVIEELKKHEESQKRYIKHEKTSSKKTKKKKKSVKFKGKPPKPVPGPSHYYFVSDSEVSSGESDMDEADLCCKCKMFSPKELHDCV